MGKFYGKDVARLCHEHNQSLGNLKVIRLEYDTDSLDLRGADLSHSCVRRMASMVRWDYWDSKEQVIDMRGCKLMDTSLGVLDTQNKIKGIHAVKDRGDHWYVALVAPIVLGDPVMIRAGCRWFTLEAAYDWWINEDHDGHHTWEDQAYRNGMIAAIDEVVELYAKAIERGEYAS